MTTSHIIKKKPVRNEFSIKTVDVGFTIRTIRPRLSQWKSLDVEVRRVRSCINVHSAWETAMENDIREINFIWKANRNPLHRGSSLLCLISPVYLT